jgi:hypothetical protein
MGQKGSLALSLHILNSLRYKGILLITQTYSQQNNLQNTVLLAQSSNIYSLNHSSITPTDISALFLV